MRIPDCHPERLHQAHGLCQECYSKWYEKNNRKPRTQLIMATCHPDKVHRAKGLCDSCYVKQWRNSVKATCHPGRIHVANGLCAACYSKQKYHSDPEKAREQANKSHREAAKKLKEQLIEAYGGKCACENCPETNKAFLTLEHIGQTGKEHREQVGSHAYADLKRRGFPQEGYTLYCWNCNAMTRYGKSCPHEEEE